MTRLIRCHLNKPAKLHQDYHHITSNQANSNAIMSFRTMLSNALFLTSILSMAGASALPSLPIDPTSLIITEGFYNGSAPIHERASTPPECAFDSHASFTYWVISNQPKPACVGRGSTFTCGSGTWDEPARAQIKDALHQVVAKDGWLSSGVAGDWYAKSKGRHLAGKNVILTLSNLQVSHLYARHHGLRRSRD